MHLLVKIFTFLMSLQEENKMRKCLILLLCFILIVSLTIPAFATDYERTTGTVILHREETLSNGITVIDEIVEVSQTRATGKTCTRTNTFKDGDTVIAVITFQATFKFDGTTVSVLSKSVTQTDTYAGWAFHQSSFTSSGGTVTLTGKLTKWLIFNSSTFTMSLTCDKDGNVSYS